MLKVIGQPWCGESVRIVKLGHLGLVEVPHNPVHIILIMINDDKNTNSNNNNGWGPAQSSSRNPESKVSFPTKIPKYQQDLVLCCYLSRPCVAWGGPASCWKPPNISFRSGFWTLTWYEGCSWLCWGGPRQGGPLQRDSLRRCCPPLSSAFRLSSSSASP